MKESFLGFNVYCNDGTACANEIASVAMSDRRDCRVIACLNPHSYVVARDDLEFSHALNSSDWLVPDGAGVVIAARWLGLSIRKRVTGPDLFMAMMTLLNQRNGSVFFLGASEQTLAKIRERTVKSYPGVVIAGTYSPPFKNEFSVEDNAAMVAAINSARPNMLWVAMTAPKQEKWLAENRAYLEVGAAGAVGAAFDFFAGTVKRSPLFFRAIGLEWLPRLVQQPRRLWRRMFISAPVFLLEVYRARSHTTDQLKK